MLDNGSKLADYWSFSIDSLTMETIDDDGNSQTDDILTTQLLDETRYGIVSQKSIPTLNLSAYRFPSK